MARHRVRLAKCRLHPRPPMSTLPAGDRPVAVPEFRAAKARGAKLAVVTAYDYASARLTDEAGVDAVLVGDSVGMVVQGHPTSLPVTLEEIIYHTRCVVRGTRRALVVSDLPFLSYQVSPRQAVRSAGRLLKEGGAAAVKLEGGRRMSRAIRAVVDAGIPVMGHVGLTPQSVHLLGGFKVQRDEAELLAEDRKSTRLNSSHVRISYAVFCWKKKKKGGL